MGFTIRQFEYPHDLGMVLELWSNAGPGIHLGRSDKPAEIEKKLARDPDLFLVAEEEGKVVGAVMGGFDGRRGMMYHLAVMTEKRGNGIASALVDELERRLHAKGCLRYYLLVVKDNEEAISFYEAHGWQLLDLLAYAKDIQ